MLVKDRMHRDPISIRKDDSLRFAADLLKEKRIRALPVVEGRKVIGIVTDRDVRQAWASSATSLEVRELYYLIEKVKVSEIMTKHVFTVSPDTTIEDAAKLLHDKKIGSLPVIEKGELVGLITNTDILEVLLEAMGMGEESARVELILDDRPGQLAEAAGIIKNHNVNVISVVTAKASTPGKRACVLRLKTTEIEKIKKDLAQAGFEVV